MPTNIDINPIATLVAAFAGSWFAFKLQKFQKDNEQTKQNVAAGNKVLMTLLQQVNTLKLFQIDFIEPFRNSPGRHVQILPTLPYEEDSLSFDIDSLEFLFTPKHQQLVMDLVLEERRYREAIKVINTRSLHHDDIQHKLERAGFKEGCEYTNEQIRSILGDYDYLHLERITDAVILHVDRTVKSLFDVKSNFRKVLQQLYPEHKLIDFELLENPPKSIFSS